MQKLSTTHHLKFQQGAAIILFSSVLLFGITSTMLFTARSGIIEQKITNNQVNSKQAKHVANIGMTAARLDVSKNKRIVDETTRALLTRTTPDGPYDTTYTRVGLDSTKVLVDIKSKSSNGLGGASIQQAFRFMSFVDTAPPATLVGGGTVTLSDTAVTLDNKSTTGSDATILCPRLRRRGATDLGTPATTTKSPSQLTVGTLRKRVISSSTVPTGDALFQSFFSNTKDNIKTFATVIDCSAGCTSTEINGKTGLLWLEGDLSMTDAAPLGVGQWNSTTDTGTPVVLIVNGNFRISHPSSSRINGLVYVTQNWNNLDGVGGRIKGSIVVEGTTEASGILELKYNSAIMDDIIANVGMYLPIPGSWKNI